MRRHTISFKHAIAGVITGFATQPNFRIHGLLSLIALLAGWYYQISSTEWAIIVLTISIGLAIELLNTSIEFTVDLLKQEYDLLAKFAKDTSAAAMLMYAIGSLFVAGFIFLPRIFG